MHKNQEGAIKRVVAMEYISSKPDTLSWVDVFNLIEVADAEMPDTFYERTGIHVWYRHENESMNNLSEDMKDLFDSIATLLK